MANIVGTNAADDLVGTLGDDVISGLGGNDTITGGNGIDVVNGGGGNDRLVVTDQAELSAGETYNGGNGFDTLDLETVAPIDLSAVTINADIEALESGGAVSLTAAQLGAFSMINTGAITLTGGGIADLTGATVSTGTFNLSNSGNTLNLTGVFTTGVTVNGGTGSDTILGGELADTLSGGDGNDTLTGNAGNDILTGGGGIDNVSGGAGDDRLVILAQSNLGGGESYSGGSGFDTLDLETADPINLSTVAIAADIEALESNAGVSLAAAQLAAFSVISTGAVTLTGSGIVDLTGATVNTTTFNLNLAGNTLDLTDVSTSSYTVNGSSGADTIRGGANGDVLNGSNGNDTLTGGGGADVLNGGGNDDTLDGGTGNDELTGSTGIDSVNGGAGNDRLIILAQNNIGIGESYAGGDGFDTLDLETASPINLSSATIAADIEVLESNNGVVSLTSAQLGAFSVVSTGAITLIDGGVADLTGATVNTSTFNLNGAGNTLDLTGVVTTSYTVNGGNGADTIVGGNNGDTLSGGNGNDIIDGGSQADSITGGAGNDTLQGGTENDTLTGGTGIDNVSGGAGDDRLIIATQSEIGAGESYSGGTGIDTLDLETASPINLSSVTIGDVEVLESTGGAVSLTAAQLGAFNLVNTGTITLTGAGIADLTGASVFTTTFNLNAAGNTLNLGGVTTNSYTVNGGIGADTIIGGIFSDLLSGGDGSDLVDGGGSSDTITGGIGNDALVGGSGSDTLTGDAGDDILSGGTENDALTGGTGVDTIDGGAGDDRMFIFTQTEIVAAESYLGGSGFDTLDLETASAIDLSAAAIGTIEALESNNGAVSLTAAQLDGFSVISTGTITLTAGGVADLTEAAVFTGTFNLNIAGNTLDLTNVANNAYTVNGNDGADTIVGGTNSDTLNGGNGNDTVSGESGFDTILGGSGDDTLSGGTENDTLTGGLGVDSVNGGSGDDRLIILGQTEIAAGESYAGGDGADLLDLETAASLNLSSVTISGIEALESNNGAVTLTASQLDALSFISTGTVTLAAGGVADLSGATVLTGTFNLNAAGNTLALTGVTTNAYTVNGGTGNDTVIGGNNSDVLNGNNGNDALEGGNGFDTLNGGNGDDTLSGGTDNDTLTGAAGLDSVSGGAGDDRLIVLAQSNIVAGESYSGGSGFDTLDLETSATITLTSVTISDIEALESNNGAVSLTAVQLGAFDVVSTGAITLTASGIADLTEATVNTSTFNLNVGGNTLNLSGVGNSFYTINGNSGADTVFGGTNADTIVGASGNDTLNGGAGNDILTGGTGLDSVNGGVGDDRLVVLAQNDLGAGESYAGGSGVDILDLETASAINLSSVTLASDIEVLESNGAVSLTAAQLDAFSTLGTGTITVTGGGIVDLTGATVFTGTFILNAAGNTLDLTDVDDGGYTVTGSIGADVIRGGTGNDVLTGGDGNDTVTGNGGSDTLTGGVGIDNVSGGAGDDRLVILAQNNLGAGESYSGGSGFDNLDLETVAAINLAAVTISTDIEGLESSGIVSLTAAQLGAFSVVNTGQITLTTGGVADLSGDTVFSSAYILNVAGNTLNLTDVSNGAYTVFGNNGVDVIIGGELGDNLNGGSNNDTLVGRAGADAMDGGAGVDTFEYQATVLNTLDVTNEIDIIANGAGDRIDFTALIENELTVGGTALSALGANTVLGSVFAADTNIRFAAGGLEIDLDADLVFTAGIDFRIDLAGVAAATYNAGLDFFALS